MKSICNVFYLYRVRRQFERAKADHPELGFHINELRNEIGYYLAAHKAAGIRFDGKHLEIIYSDGVTVVLRQTLGIWIITRLVLTLPVWEYRPVFGFKSVKEGAIEVVRRVFRYWISLFDTPPSFISYIHGNTGHPLYEGRPTNE